MNVSRNPTDSSPRSPKTSPMKKTHFHNNSCIPFALASAIATMLATIPQLSQAAVITWANVGTAWPTTTNWVGGIVPGTGDDALFNSASYSGCWRLTIAAHSLDLCVVM